MSLVILNFKYISLNFVGWHLNLIKFTLTIIHFDFINWLFKLSANPVLDPKLFDFIKSVLDYFH